MALSILRLIPYPGRVEQGRILLNGVDLVSMKPSELQAVRGRKIGLVFQDPRNSLNPVISIGIQVEEVLLAHSDISKREARD